MKIGVIDIETNAIEDWTHLTDLEKVHCLCIYDVDAKKTYRYNEQCNYPMLNTMREGLEHASKFDVLVAHNGTNFDFPALQKIYGFKHPNTMDTKVMACCIYPDIKILDYQRESFPPKLIGSHSLKAWGTRINEYKGDFGEETDWSSWSKEMEDYCVQDVIVTGKLYEYLMKKKPSCQMLDLEHKFAVLMRNQEVNGFPFDVSKAEELTKVLSMRRVELLDELQEVFPPKIETMKSRMWVTAHGMEFSTKKEAIAEGYSQVVQGAYKTKEIPFNPNSRDQIAERLMEAGWRPQAYDGKRPAINESVLREIGTEQADKLLEFLTISKRLGQLIDGKNAWLKMVSEGRIHGKVNTNGTVSGRCSHMFPNIAQVPATSAPYGAECRELFTAPEGKVLVGCDASGLELRCLAHYLYAWDSGAYGRRIVEDDIHTVNQHAAGLETRNQAKTFIYGWLYGAGDAKIGQIVGGSSRDGKRLKQNFTSQLPAVRHLLSAVKKKVETKGILMGLDGRELPARSSHSALNLLLQSAGAVIMKQALIEFVDVATEPYELHANVHDEVQFSCLSEHADKLGSQFVDSIKKAGTTLNFNCALDGEFHVGQSWKETH